MLIYENSGLAKFNGKIETSHGYSDMSSNTEQESLQQLLEKKRTAKCKEGEEEARVSRDHAGAESH